MSRYVKQTRRGFDLGIEAVRVALCSSLTLKPCVLENLVLYVDQLESELPSKSGDNVPICKDKWDEHCPKAEHDRNRHCVPDSSIAPDRTTHRVTYLHLEEYTCECGTEVARMPSDDPKLCLECEEERS